MLICDRCKKPEAETANVRRRVVQVVEVSTAATPWKPTDTFDLCAGCYQRLTDLIRATVDQFVNPPTSSSTRRAK